MKSDHSRKLDKPINLGKRASPNPALVLSLSIFVSESLIFYGFIGYALWIYLSILLVCTVGLVTFKRELSIFISFALVPLFRLVNIGMPILPESPQIRIIFIYAPFLPALFIFPKIQESNEPIFLSKSLDTIIFFPLVLLLSFIFANIEYQIIQTNALISNLNYMGVIFIALIMVGLVGLIEEFLFRGMLQRAFEESLGKWPGIVLASAVFGAMHSSYSIPMEILLAFSLGFVFGLLYDFTDNLLILAILHGLINTFLFTLIPLRSMIFIL